MPRPEEQLALLEFLLACEDPTEMAGRCLEWLAEHARGKTLMELTAQGLEEVVGHLDIPTEKLGRLLIVQDALRDCRAA